MTLFGQEFGFKHSTHHQQIGQFSFFRMETSSSQVTIQHSHTKLWSKALSFGYSAALWRLPKSSDKHLIIDTSGKVDRVKIDLEDTQPGFAFSPFLNPDGTQTLLIKADIYFRFDADNQWIEDDLDMGRKLIRSIFLDDDFPINQSKGGETEQKLIVASDDSSAAAYITSVRQAVEAIQSGQMQKVVLSRSKDIQLSDSFEVVEAFDKLCRAYPNAFVSAVYLPDEQAVWLGASPETLVSMNRDGIFRTISLAGTQSAYDADGQLVHPSEARWTQKEIEEQALVSRYIISCFKQIRLREFVEIGPKTVLAGNLLHLRTDYEVDTQAVNFSQLGTVMLNLLHPTSAVCGMPKAPALDFILHHEQNNREFYSGFLGPVNVQQETHLFVNLRTMKIQQQHARLFAGAGITEDSIPEKEWKETEMKCETLLSVVFD